MIFFEGIAQVPYFRGLATGLAGDASFIHKCQALSQGVGGVNSNIHSLISWRVPLIWEG